MTFLLGISQWFPRQIGGVLLQNSNDGKIFGFTPLKNPFFDILKSRSVLERFLGNLLEHFFFLKITWWGDFFIFFNANTYHCVQKSKCLLIVLRPPRYDFPNFFYITPKSKSFRFRAGHYRHCTILLMTCTKYLNNTTHYVFTSGRPRN